MRTSREISFEAKHSHHGMMVEPVHSHQFTVRLTFEGTPNEEGFLCDFRAVKRVFKRVILSELEHRNLDELFEFATSENLAQWIWQKMEVFFPLYSVEVREKPHSSAVYFGAGKRKEHEAD